MTKVEVLELLQELFRNSVISVTQPDDPSGLSTQWLVDQEALLANIERELEKERGE